MNHPATGLDRAGLELLLAQMFAPWIAGLGLRVEGLGEDSVTLVLPFAPELCHAGGVICGQATMAAADTAMVLAIAHRLGDFRPMTTVSLNTSFLRPIPSGDVIVVARVLRLGKNLVFGEIEQSGADGRLAVHATTTYALL